MYRVSKKIGFFDVLEKLLQNFYLFRILGITNKKWDKRFKNICGTSKNDWDITKNLKVKSAVHVV